MSETLLILTIVLALASLAAGAGVLAFGDRAFTARLAARARRGPAEGMRTAAGLRLRVLSLLGRWGAQAGRGAVETDKRGDVRLRLMQAGFYADRAVEIFFGIRAVAAIGLGAAGAFLAQLLHAKGALGLAAGLMAGANAGLFLPNLLVGARIGRRRRALQLGLPDAIDLMVVSVEAGATLSAALQRVVAEFGDLHPVLSEQFGLMMMEMQAGASRTEALGRLAVRSASDEVRTLSTLLIQSEAVGASLGATLRVFADELRKARFLEAERKAAELPVKLSFPLVLCIFPCLVGVIFIPTAIRILRAAAGFHP